MSEKKNGPPSGFGLAFVRMEGKAMHPDDTDTELGDEFYIKQAQAYIRDSGDVHAFFVRDELLGRILEGFEDEN